MLEVLTKDKWLEMNGFSPFGVTYLIIGNSYSIKEELKNNGFIYSPLLRWHAAEMGDIALPEGCSFKKIEFDELFTWDPEQNAVFMLPGTREKLTEIFNPIEITNSEYVGEIGERLRDIPVTIKNISGFDSVYGYKWVYVFVDENENIYSWFTTTSQPVNIGERFKLTGTVKGHVIYKGSKNTQLSRCKLDRP